MKKSKSFKKALLPAIALLIAAIVSLTSVTYAWFTYGDSATVDQIDVNVEAAGGLQISMGYGENDFQWGSSISPVISDKQIAPVSSTGSVTDGALNFYTATYDDTYDKIHSIQTASASETTSPYITFDVYFRNAEAKAKTVDISGSTVTSTSGNSNLAVRMAFVTQGEISSTAADQNAEKFDSMKYNGTEVDIYEPNFDKHTSAGETDYLEVNKMTANDDGSYNYRAIATADNSASNYYNRYTGVKYSQVSTTEEGTTYYVYDADAENIDKFST